MEVLDIFLDIYGCLGYLLIVMSPFSASMTTLALKSLLNILRFIFNPFSDNRCILIGCPVIGPTINIGFIEEGQQAETKIEAFPFTKYGVMSCAIQLLRLVVEQKYLLMNISI